MENKHINTTEGIAGKTAGREKAKAGEGTATAARKKAGAARLREEPLAPPQSEAGIERYARSIEKETKRAIADTPMVPVWIDPVVGKAGEVLTYRLNGVTYHIKTKQVVEVPEALAMVIYDQSRRKKLSARYVQEYVTGFGKGMGELR